MADFRSEVQVRARATHKDHTKKTDAGKATRGVWYPTVVKTGAYENMSVSGMATGAGVTIGVIDTGIDVFNPAFFSISGTKARPRFHSRIAAVWAQYDTPKTTAEKNRTRTWLKKIGITQLYGTVYLRDDIRAMLEAHYKTPGASLGTRPKLSFLSGHHGTTCAGLAAGHGSATVVGSFMGVAPRSEIVAVQNLPPCLESEIELWEGYVFPDNPIKREQDAMNFIEKVVREKDPTRPFVINKSYGRDSGVPFHQNSSAEIEDDFVTDPVSGVIGGKKGVVIVGGAGNEGAQAINLHFKTRPVGSGTAEQSVKMRLIDQRMTFGHPDSCASPKETEFLRGVLKGFIHIPAAHARNLPKFGVVAQERKLTPSGKVLPSEKVGCTFLKISKNGKSIPPPLKELVVGTSYDTPKALYVGSYPDLRINFSSEFEQLGPTGEGYVKFDLSILRQSQRKANAKPGPLVAHSPAALKDPVEIDLIIDAPGGVDVILMSEALAPLGGNVLHGLEFTRVIHDTTWADVKREPVAATSGWSGTGPSTLRRYRTADGAAAKGRIATAATVSGNKAKVAEFSNRGPLFPFVAGSLPVKPTVSAPGQDVFGIAGTPPLIWDIALRSINPGLYKKTNGTSFSAPLVAGTAALMLELDKTLTASLIERRLRQHVDPAPGRAAAAAGGKTLLQFEADQGAGPLDAFAVVAALIP
ncbi:MAG: S8 family serine peptidase [Pseudomonadota bacterium]